VGSPISLAYACAYPLGVVGIIVSTIALKHLCRVDLKHEQEDLDNEADLMHAKPYAFHLEVYNESLVGKNLAQIRSFMNRPFVCSRIRKNGVVSSPEANTVIELHDQLLIVSSEENADAITAFIGRRIEVDWEHQTETEPMISRRILVTRSEINGKHIADIHFRSLHGVTVTRINRSGIDLFARPNLVLQVGDRVTVVGYEDAVGRVASVLGNSMKRLNHPNIVTLFIGILLGVFLGSLPWPSGMATPLKLGLAGGPLIVAILIGAFGYKLKLVTYTTASANLMLREVGITLFLASVGIKAGPDFLRTVMDGDGFTYVWCGFLITTVPILVAGLLARYVYKMNYFTLMGVIAGSTTDPPALAFAGQSAGNDGPSVGYSTVYPLAMFLRILTGQMIVLLLLG
jgi:putative transport protein